MMLSVTEVDAILAAAIELATPEERAEYIQRVCGQDAELRRRVEELLAAHFQAGDFLERPPATVLYRDEDIQAAPGTVIGPYKLLQQIGEGGMGVVFMAEQKEPIHRIVALKIIKPGMDTRQVIARFEAERQALAVMDHPNIAKVLDAGTTDAGRPYFVMELVKGVPITDYCDRHHKTIRQRLELVTDVCHAVQHAHQKGIIHRDLKPTNVLIAEYDGQPVPKIIDFGVAKATAQKLTERTMFTEFGQIIGTFEYMSPEQASFNQLDIDTRSDIYSLGVLLYELLSGGTPFDRKRLRAAAFDEVLRIIREEEPPAPSTKLNSTETTPSVAANRGTEPARLSKDIRGELDWIVMRSLEKDRQRRYQSASGLADDIERFLRDEPVQAGRPSAAYRFRKFAVRNKAGLISAGLIAIALLAGSIISTWQAIRATHALARETELRKEAELKNKVTEAERLCALGNFDGAEKLISTIPTRIIEMEPQAATLAFRDLANWNGGLQRWQKAADHYHMFLVGPAQRGSGRPDEFSMDYLSYAPVLLELGDKPGYERLRESAIAKMGGSNELIVAERILLACLLLPYEDEQLPTFDKWAQVDITLNQGCWACAALALLEHRRGRYDEALNWCNKSLNTGLEPQLGVTPAKREGSNTPLTCAVRAHIIRAMSYAELQQVETARAALANYPDMIESKFRGEFGMGTYESGFWKDWLIDRILLREALVLIKKSDQMTKPRQAADSDSPAEKREKTTED